MSKTAYLYDPIFLEHKTGLGHPEKPERLTAIDSRLKKCSFFRDLIKIRATEADLHYVELNHDPSYIKKVKRQVESGSMALDMDTFICPRSFEVALHAVGGCLNMCDAVMSGEAENGFCSVRPPGHHAERDEALGFCLFNNIAIMARYLKARYKLERIAIVDWDVHHGNGTQHSFEEDDSVYYMSLHQYPHFPGSGASTERGRGRGLGFTLNIPMERGSGDSEYQEAFQKQILPQLESYKPECILISAGFDAHRADYLAAIKLSTASFHAFTVCLKELALKYAEGRMIAVLEGGYNLEALSESVVQMMEGMQAS